MNIDYQLTGVQRAALAEKYSLRRAEQRLETKLRGLEIEAVIGLEIEELTKTPSGWVAAVSLAYRLTHEAATSAPGRVILREEGPAIEVALAGAMAGAVDAVLGHVRLLNGRAA